MRAEKRKSYTAECKREAVRLVTEQQDGVAEAARNVGSNVKRLRRWKRAVADSDKGAFPGKGRLSPAHEEWHRLRTENKRLRMEHEILKNGCVAFARHLWWKKLPPVAYHHWYGRSDRRLIGGSDPVKKHGPGNFADVRVVTPLGDPV